MDVIFLVLFVEGELVRFYKVYTVGVGGWGLGVWFDLGFIFLGGLS